tara:strand:+ start:2131 stop:2337 length:207 start_codon:yes stop_codon:yes gene_type:complete
VSEKIISYRIYKQFVGASAPFFMAVLFRRTKMIVFNYPSKKNLKENVGQGREFFATVTMRDGKIAGVK